MPRRRKPRLSVETRRDAAMNGRPRQMPYVSREEKDGKLYVTVSLERPRWQRVLGADHLCDRTFGLDNYGRLVYESCTGKKSVKQIIAGFAEKTHVSRPEAEVAVTQFMRTLMSKGLVMMEMEKLSS